MEEENKTEQKPEEQKDVKTQVLKEISISVKEALSGSATLNKERLVNKMKEEEINRRVNLLEQAVTKQKEAEKKVKAIQPDQKLVDATGKTTIEAFTPAKQKELKQAQENLDRLEKAFEKCFEEPIPSDAFNKLEEAIKKA